MFNRFKKTEVVEKRQITPQRILDDIMDIDKEAAHSPAVAEMRHTCDLCSWKRIRKAGFMLLCTRCKDEISNNVSLRNRYRDLFIANSIKRHSKRLQKYCKEAVEHYVKLGKTRPEREELQRHIDNTKWLKPYQIYN